LITADSGEQLPNQIGTRLAMRTDPDVAVSEGVHCWAR